MSKTAFLINGAHREFSGRTAWALERLTLAGVKGITVADLPAGCRWSAYVLKLRRSGVLISMEREHHEGPFPGEHGRYRLACHTEIIGERRTDVG